MKITYELTGFNSKTKFKNKKYDLNINWAEIHHAAITLGRKTCKDVLFHEYHSFQEVNFRFYMVEAFLKEENKIIKISNAYKTLDPSEKGAINYFNGGIFTSIIAKRIFDTPWIMHLDVYKNNLYDSGGLEITYNTEGIRPDFIGLNDLHEYNVFESKGRVSFSNESLDRAYEQSKNIKTVNSKIPRWKLGSITSHDNSNFKLKIKDPEKSNDNAIHLKFNEKDFFINYYALVFNYIKNSDFQKVERNGIEFITTLPNCHNFVLGLEKGIYDAINQIQNQKEALFFHINENLQANKLYTDSFQEINLESSDTHIGNDGIMLKLLKNK